MSEQSRRQFLELMGKGAASIALLQVIPACESFNLDQEGDPTPYTFLTPANDWYWFSAAGWEPQFSPIIPPDDWRLDIRSGGRSVAEVTFRKLKALEADGEDISYVKTMRCVFGSYANDLPDTLTATGVFRGIPLKRVLDDTSISGEVSKLRFAGYDGFETSISYDRLIDEEKFPVMLAYELNGRPLTPQRGGPVRLIVPEMWAFKSLKWLVTLDATTDFSSFGTFETGEFGGKPEFDNPGLMSLMALVEQPNALRVEVPGPDLELRGMALVGGSRISAVEISVDDEEFVRATIPNIDTVLEGLGRDALLVRSAMQFTQDFPYPNVWAPWSHTVTGLSSGAHRIIVRAVDQDGNANPSISADAQLLAQHVVIDLEVT